MWFFHHILSGRRPLWGFFVPLKVAFLHEHLDMVAFPLTNGFGKKVLENIFFLLVLHLVLKLQLVYLPFVPYAFQYLHQNQTKVILNIHQPSSQWELIYATLTHFQITPNF